MSVILALHRVQQVEHHFWSGVLVKWWNGLLLMCLVVGVERPLEVN